MLLWSLWGTGTMTCHRYSLFYYFFVPTMLYSYPVHFNYELAQPAALIPLVAEGGLLQANQAYDVHVTLIVPDTERNREIGMFMVKLAIASGWWMDRCSLWQMKSHTLPAHARKRNEGRQNGNRLN